VPGRRLVQATRLRTVVAAERRRSATGLPVAVSLLIDDVGGKLEVASEVLERKAARAQHVGEPHHLAPEDGRTLGVEHRPCRQ
jgi:hypothetical protein